MFHLSAYYGSLAAGPVDCPAVTDGIIQLQNGHLLPSQPMRVIGAMAIGNLLTTAQITSPTIRLLSPANIRPVINGAVIPPTNPNFDRYYIAPLSVFPYEELACTVTNSGAGPTTTNVFLWLSTGITPIPQGPVYRIPWTATYTAVAQTWTQVPYTLTTQLPAGTYVMVSAEMFGASCLAHRYTFDNQYFRPGMPGCATQLLRGPDCQYEYQMGVMGQFVTTNAPRIEAFCTAADASATGFLHVIKMM